MNENFIFESLKRKLSVISGSNLTSEEIKKALDPVELEILEKAQYIRREGTKGNYKYVYDEPKSKISLDYRSLSDKELNNTKKNLLDSMKKVTGHKVDQKTLDKMSEQLNNVQKEIESRKNKEIKTSKEPVPNNVKDFAKKFGNSMNVEKYGTSDKIVVKFNKDDNGLREKIRNEVHTNSDLNRHLSTIDSVEGKVVFHLDKAIEPDIEKKNEAKIAIVMKEFKDGTLKDSHGKKVTDRDQALAIAFSEAGMSKKSEDEDVEKCATSKAIENDIEKGGVAMVGEIRNWNNAMYRKVGPGKWEPVEPSRYAHPGAEHDAPTSAVGSKGTPTQRAAELSRKIDQAEAEKRRRSIDKVEEEKKWAEHDKKHEEYQDTKYELIDAREAVDDVEYDIKQLHIDMEEEVGAAEGDHEKDRLGNKYGGLLMEKEKKLDKKKAEVKRLEAKLESLDDYEHSSSLWRY